MTGAHGCFGLGEKLRVPLTGGIGARPESPNKGRPRLHPPSSKTRSRAVVNSLVGEMRLHAPASDRSVQHPHAAKSIGQPADARLPTVGSTIVGVGEVTTADLGGTSWTRQRRMFQGLLRRSDGRV